MVLPNAAARMRAPVQKYPNPPPGPIRSDRSCSNTPRCCFDGRHTSVCPPVKLTQHKSLTVVHEIPLLSDESLAYTFGKGSMAVNPLSRPKNHAEINLPVGQWPRRGPAHGKPRNFSGPRIDATRQTTSLPPGQRQLSTWRHTWQMTRMKHRFSGVVRPLKTVLYMYADRLEPALRLSCRMLPFF